MAVKDSPAAAEQRSYGHIETRHEHPLFPSVSCLGHGPLHGGDNHPGHDRDRERLELEQRFQALASPFRTAEAIGLDIIDPRDTRALLCDFVEMVQGVIKTQLGQGAGPTYWP